MTPGRIRVLLYLGVGIIAALISRLVLVGY